MDSCRFACVRGVTVEPVLFLFTVGAFMQFVVFQSLIYSKVCEAHYADEVCVSLDSARHADEKRLVQSLSSYWLLASNVALSVPATLSTCLLGSATDRLSRKLPLVLPSVGQIFGSLVYMLMAAVRAAPVSLVVVANFLAGISGSFPTCLLGATAYVSGVSAHTRRTSRLATVEAMSMAGALFGPLLAAAVQSRAGTQWALCVVIVVNALCVAYTLALLADVDTRAPPVPPPDSPTRPFYCGVLQYFALWRLCDTLHVASRPRASSRRRCILLVLFVGLVVILNTAGEMNVTYLYVRDSPINGSSTIYDIYSAVKCAMGVVCLLAVLPALRRLTTLDDISMCMLAVIFRTTGLIWLSITSNITMLFIAPFVAMLSSFGIPPLRSLLSKLVEPQEQGRSMSLLSALESLCTLFGSVLYNGIYPATQQRKHGLVFFIGAALMALPALFLFLLRRALPDNDGEAAPDDYQDVDTSDIATVSTLPATDTDCQPSPETSAREAPHST